MSKLTLSLGAAGQTIGLLFLDGSFYKWSGQLDCWCLVDPIAATVAIQRITDALTELPFAVPLSASLNVDGGSHHVH